MGIPFLVRLVKPELAEIELSLREEKNRFLLTIRNLTSSKVSISTHTNAWIVRVVDRQGRAIASFENYLQGGEENGVTYYPPHLRVPLQSDWIALPSGAALTLPVYPYNTAGVLKTLPRSYTAWVDINLATLIDSAPAWAQDGTFRIPSKVISKRLSK